MYEHIALLVKAVYVIHRLEIVCTFTIWTAASILIDGALGNEKLKSQYTPHVLFTFAFDMCPVIMWNQ